MWEEVINQMATTRQLLYKTGTDCENDSKSLTVDIKIDLMVISIRSVSESRMSWRKLCFIGKVNVERRVSMIFPVWTLSGEQK